jgi:hypothetical protein
VRVHHFYAGPHRTHDDRPICEACGAVETARVHRVPAVPEDARAIDERKLGEAS